MKNILFKLLAVGLLVPSLIFANEKGIGNGKYTKEKTVKENFKVTPTALLKVKNSYGNLTLNSWEQNEISIVVQIIANGNNEDKVAERLEEININFSNTKDIVEAITQFNKNNNNWGWNWNRGGKVNVQVNYTINLPVKASINLSNDYGNIYLDRVDGHAKINCDYGKMEIGELRGRNNELRFDYTSRSSFDYINSAIIYADYSGFTVTKSGELTLNADYTNATINQADYVKYSNDYGSLQIDKATDVYGNGSYIGVKLGEINGNVDINADYGSIKIGKMSTEAGNLRIKSDYTGITIGYSKNFFFDFDIETEYAGVSGKDDLIINVSREKSFDKYYQGYYGRENSGNKVSITSSYGGITFKKSE